MHAPIRRRPRSAKPTGKAIHIYVSNSEKASIKAAARREGVSLSAFCANHLIAAAQRILKKKP